MSQDFLESLLTLPALEERSGEHWLYLPAVQQEE